MLVDITGPEGPDEVWRRFVTPSLWSAWAPHINRTQAAHETIAVGTTGRVWGPAGIAVDFEVTAVDHELRTWTWQVGRGPARIRMDHVVLPAPGGGSRAMLRITGPAAVPLQGYRPMAAAALRRLTARGESPSPPRAAAEEVTTFDFAFSPAWALAGRAFGITPASAVVEVGPAWLHARYGPWRLVTPRANVAGATVTGGFHFVKTAGPPHLSFADGGVSFTPNGDRALCVRFHEPVSAIDPTGSVRHPAATLGVSDLEGLAHALGC